jgi:hypothetical protein
VWRCGCLMSDVALTLFVLLQRGEDSVGVIGLGAVAYLYLSSTLVILLISPLQPAWLVVRNVSMILLGQGSQLVETHVIRSIGSKVTCYVPQWCPGIRRTHMQK